MLGTGVVGTTSLTPVKVSASARAVSTRTSPTFVNPGTRFSSSPLRTTGLYGAVTYSLTSGSLPSGWALDSSTGVISGALSDNDTHVFTVTATAAYWGSASLAVTIAPSASVELLSSGGGLTAVVGTSSAAPPIGLTASGVSSWGWGGWGQLGRGSRIVRGQAPGAVVGASLPAGVSLVQVSSGGAHSLGLGSDGWVYAWGDNHFGQLGWLPA